MKKLSDVDKIKIVKKYINGFSGIKLSELFNVTKQNIYQILKSRNIPLRKRGRKNGK